MKIDQLENLVEVVKSGSINSAAKKVYVSQQSLNKALHNLEEELGVEILYRTKRGVRLTEQGEIVYSNAIAIIERYHNMLRDLHNINGLDKRHINEKLTIHIAPMLSISILPKAYIEYMHNYPKMQVYCQEKYRTDIIQEVADNPGDAGFLLVPSNMDSFFDSIPECIDLYLLREYPIYVAMSARHPLSHHHRLSVSAIAEYPIIVYEAGGVEGRHAFQNEKNFRVALSTSNAQICQEMLAEGQAIMYSFPPYVERSVFSNFVHIPVQGGKTVFQCFLATNKKSTTKQRKLIDTFSVVFQEYL